MFYVTESQPNGYAAIISTLIFGSLFVGISGFYQTSEGVGDFDSAQKKTSTQIRKLAPVIQPIPMMMDFQMFLKNPNMVRILMIPIQTTME